MSKFYRGWIAVGGQAHVLVTNGPNIPTLLQADVNEFADRVGQVGDFDWGVPSRATFVLARMLLVDALGKDLADQLETAEFMEQVLVRFPKGPDWELSAHDVARWAESAMRKRALGTS